MDIVWLSLGTAHRCIVALSLCVSDSYDHDEW